MMNWYEAEMGRLKALLTAATKRAEKAESQRDRMREVLRHVAELTFDADERGNERETAINQFCFKALKEVDNGTP